jgi:hypothetical protein
MANECNSTRAAVQSRWPTMLVRLTPHVGRTRPNTNPANAPTVLWMHGSRQVQSGVSPSSAFLAIHSILSQSSCQRAQPHGDLTRVSRSWQQDRDKTNGRHHGSSTPKESSSKNFFQNSTISVLREKRSEQEVQAQRKSLKTISVHQ